MAARRRQRATGHLDWEAGQGEGASYRPYIRVRDFGSRGVCNQIPGTKVARQHELLSDFEESAFIVAERPRSVIDMREQFALDLKVTLEIAAALRVKHPTIRGSGQPAVMTTDFVRTKTGPLGRSYEAFACTYSKDLKKKRVLEKLEIQRTYWELRHVPWILITERDLPPELVTNLRWMRLKWFFSSPAIPADQMAAAAELLFARILENPDRPLRETLDAVNDEQGWIDSEAACLVAHALARRWWRVPDLGVAVDFTKRPPPLSLGSECPWRMP